MIKSLPDWSFWHYPWLSLRPENQNFIYCEISGRIDSQQRFIFGFGSNTDGVAFSLSSWADRSLKHVILLPDYSLQMWSFSWSNSNCYLIKWHVNYENANRCKKQLSEVPEGLLKQISRTLRNRWPPTKEPGKRTLADSFSVCFKRIHDQFIVVVLIRASIKIYVLLKEIGPQFWGWVAQKCIL